MCSSYRVPVIYILDRAELSEGLIGERVNSDHGSPCMFKTTLSKKTFVVWQQQQSTDREIEREKKKKT